MKPPYDLTHRIGMPTHVTSVMWLPVLNQLLVGCGDRTTGSVHVLYSPERSERGALLCAGKKNRPKSPLDFQPTPIIHTPRALPMFRDDSWRKRKRPPEGGAVRVFALFFYIFHRVPTCVCALLALAVER